MKKFQSLFTLAVIAVSVTASCVPTTKETVAPQSLTTFVEPERTSPVEGMLFDSKCVVEEYEYDDAYCIVYDDPDCNVFNAEVCLDLESYIKVIDAIAADEQLVGEFAVNAELSTPDLTVWSIVENPEFEQATASANF